MTPQPLSASQKVKLAVISVPVFVVSLSFLVAADRPDDKPHFAGPQSCQPCHQEIYETSVQTAHFKTSQTADEHSIRGSFAYGRNILKTGNPNVYFEMGRRKDGFYQTAFQSAESLHGSRRERFDLVIGSGRKGQSYLYWKDGLLYQLPVSYLKAGDRWANSPGMVDGQVVFDRFISPRCLECHATLFRAELTGSKVQYSRKFLLGLSCEKCHGAASTHVAFHKANSRATAGRYILNPEQFPREQKLDQCGLCHSGAGTSIKPPFSYRPGDPLTEYLEIDPVRKDARPDVHGNQVGLLRLSRCFAASDDMSCSTCHNVHKEERDLPQLARKCARCHGPQECALVREVGSSLQEHCIGCHMPNQRSKVITIASDTDIFAQSYRNHMIAIYPQATQRVLNRLKAE